MKPMKMKHMKNKQHCKRGILLLLALLCMLSGCSYPGTGNIENPEPDYFRINGKNVYFVSDQEKQTWVEYLTRLLANEAYTIMSETGPDEYVIPFPDMPYIEQCYACGLFDMNGDGTPELLVRPWGAFGSSGATSYYAYDIYTGQLISDFDGSLGGSFCYYYNTETGALQLVSQYSYRVGWSGRERFLSVSEYSAESKSFESKLFLRADYDIDAEERYDDSGTSLGWYEFYPDTVYWVNGEDASLDSYCAELDSFTRTSLRIPETALQMISWKDVTFDESERFERAREMAEALVSSGQKFIAARN